MSKKVTSLGIDLSTSATGLVLLEEGSNSLPPEVIFETEVKSGEKGIARNAQIVADVMAVIQEYNPTKIVLEGYSLSTKNASSIIPLVEIGALLRFMMKIEGYIWYDPRANEIKKFVTGKGNAPKDIVMMHVLKRWGHTSKTNNTADAYVCAAMGLAQCNRLPGSTLDMMTIACKMQANSN